MYKWKELYRLLNIHNLEPSELPPSYNVAPSHAVPVCRLGPDGERELVLPTWGFLPSWAKDDTKPVINAKSETVATSGMFRSAFASRRCLIPASGFYEWKALPGGKQPMYFSCVNDPVFCFAGIWEWRQRGDGGATTFAILTTTPNAVVAPVHNRMPVILRREHWDTWMGLGVPDASVFEPFPAEEMLATPVSTRVNSPRNDDPSLITPVDSSGSSLWG